jgi:hypothetical protein
MGDGIQPDQDELERLSELCAGLAGRVGNGELLAWVREGDASAVAHEVFEVVSDAGLLADASLQDPAIRVRNRYPSQPVSLPADGDALMSRMWEIEEPEAIGLLTSLAESAGWGQPRRHLLRRGPEERPEDVFTEMASLTGADARWWTNTDLAEWNPITQHNFDAVIVAAGNGLILTVIAFEGG